MHPFRYNRWSNVHDIALLKVAKPIKFDNPAVGPACLPNKGQNNEGSQNNWMQFCLRVVVRGLYTKHVCHPID